MKGIKIDVKTRAVKHKEASGFMFPLVDTHLLNKKDIVVVFVGLTKEQNYFWVKSMKERGEKSGFYGKLKVAIPETALAYAIYLKSQGMELNLLSGLDKSYKV